MADIIDFGHTKFKRKPASYQCRHRTLVLDSEHHTVECEDCGQNIGAFKALTMLANRRHTHQEKIKRQIEELRALEKKNISLKAAAIVEREWRRRKTVPNCPHCQEAIFPNDGFGRTAVDKTTALERRRFRASTNPTCKAHGRFPCRECGTKHYEGCSCAFCK